MLRRLPVAIDGNCVVGEGLGGEELRADFVLRGSTHFSDGLAVKVRTQRGSGSVDEKLYALGVNIPACYQIPAILVLVGDGFREGIVNWLRTRTGLTLRAVLTVEELEAWLWENL